MSTCPDKELFSVYLDNELPEPYRSRLESHLEACPDCSARLARMKSVQAALRSEADQLTLTDEDMAVSFDRLQARMRFQKTTKRSGNQFGSIMRKMAPAIAAAAVFAVILPLRLLKNEDAGQTVIMPTAQTASFLPYFTSQGITKSIGTAFEEAKKAVRTDVSTSTFTTTVDLEETNLAKIDIFRPEFPDNVIRITIDLGTVPGVSPVSVSSEGTK